MKTSPHTLPVAAPLLAACVALCGPILVLPITRANAQYEGGFGPLAYQHRIATLLKTANRNAAARRLAIERLQFLWWLSRKYSFRLYEYGWHEGNLLFPAGRSDRAYVVIWNGDWPGVVRGYAGGAQDTCILCCQRKEGDKYSLVYRVNFTGNSNNPVSDDQRKHLEQASIKSLQDYVQSHNCHFQRPLSLYARADLAVQRDYVGYTDDYMNRNLKVFLLSTGESPHNAFEIEHYSFDQDPITKAKLKEDDFYHKYGLPVSLSELKKLQPQLPPELLAPPPDPFACGDKDKR